MSRTTCPDCNEELQPIKMIDATFLNMVWEGVAHDELSYTTPDASPSIFRHTYERKGTVQGRLCPKCGRILLYAGPA